MKQVKMSSDEFKKANAIKFAKKSKGVKQTANALTKAALDTLSLFGFKSYRNNNAAVYDKKFDGYRKFTGLKGVPDICGFCRKTGAFVGVEIKAGKDKLSIHQSDFLNALNKSGGFGYECRDIDGLIVAIENFRKNQNMKIELFKNEKVSNCCSSSVEMEDKNGHGKCNECGESCTSVETA